MKLALSVIMVLWNMEWTYELIDIILYATKIVCDLS